MKLFSDCAGNCCICRAGGRGCLAGIGDNDYMPATKEQVIENLDKNYFEWDRQKMIDYLKNEFGYDYEKK